MKLLAALFSLALAASSFAQQPKKCPAGGIGAKFHYKCAAGVDTGGTAGASLGGKCYQAGHIEPGGGADLLTVCIRPDGSACRGGDPGTTIPNIPKFAKGFAKEEKCGKMLMRRNIGMAASSPNSNTPKPNTGDPIDILSGDNTDLVTDLDISAPKTSIPLSFIRVYSSQNVRTGPMGKSWWHNFATKLTPLGKAAHVFRDPLTGKLHKFGDNISEDSLEITTARGRRLLFKKSGSIYVEEPANEGSSVLINGDGSYDWSRPSKTVYHFDSGGKLLSIKDPFNNVITLEYSGGRLQTIRDFTDRTIYTLAYDGAGNLSSLTDVFGRVVNYYYTNGLLTKVSGLNGDTVYQYGGTTGDLLTGRIDPSGRQSNWSYTPAAPSVNTAHQPSAQQLGSGFSAPNGCQVVVADVVTGAVGGGALASPANVNPDVYADWYGSTDTVALRGSYGPTASAVPFETASVSDFSCGVFDIDGGVVMAPSAGSGGGSVSSSPREKVIATSYQGGTDDVVINPIADFGQDSDAVTVQNALKQTQTFTRVNVAGGKRIGTATNALGQTTAYEYNANGQLAAETNFNGAVTRYAYDADGQLTSLTDALGHTLNQSWDPTHKTIKSTTDPLGHSVTLNFNSLGRVSSVVDALGQSQAMTYDSSGQLLTVTDKRGNQAVFGYDSLGNLISVKDPLSREIRTTFDSLGRPTAITYPNNKSVAMTYNARSAIESVTDMLGRTIQMSYRAADSRLIEVQDSLGHKTNSLYDSEGKITSQTNPLGKTTRFTYNAVGMPVRTDFPNGQGVEIFYDDIKRPIKTVYSDDEVKFTFDDMKMTSVIEDSNGKLEMTFDLLGNVRSSRQTDKETRESFTLLYNYDSDGKRSSLDAPFGKFSYTYDALHRLTALTNFKNQTFSFAYDANSNQTGIVYPNGITTSHAFDAASRLSAIESARSGVTLDSQTFTFDAVDNVIAMRDHVGLHSYSYNDASWLLSATHPTAARLLNDSESYAYDPAGNRTADPRYSDYVYDAANRLVSNSSFTYVYDDNGSLILKTNAQTGQKVKYAYDGRKRLISIEDEATGRKSSFRYDPLGRRMTKTIRLGAVSQKWRYYYDAASIVKIVIEDADALGRVTSQIFLFTPGPGLDFPLALHGSSDMFFHSGHIGSISAISDDSGAIVERMQYEGFGKTVFQDAVSGATSPVSMISGNPYGYTAREFDGDTGLYFYRMRYYDPSIGRFLQEDPVFAVNRFFYVDNNPVNKRDPTGAIPWAGRLAKAQGWSPKNIAGLGPAIKSVDKAITDLYKTHSSWADYFGNGSVNNIARSPYALAYALHITDDLDRGCSGHQDRDFNALDSGIGIQRFDLSVDKIIIGAGMFKHRAVVVYPTGTDWQQTGVVVDPWANLSTRPQDMLSAVGTWQFNHQGIATWASTLRIQGAGE